MDYWYEFDTRALRAELNFNSRARLQRAEPAAFGARIGISFYIYCVSGRERAADSNIKNAVHDLFCTNTRVMIMKLHRPNI